MPSFRLRLALFPFEKKKSVNVLGTSDTVFIPELDALRVFTRASYQSIKSYFTKTCTGHNKSKLKNQDILAQEFCLTIYYSCCFVEYPHPITSCEFKPVWFKNEAQLSMHWWRSCLQRIFEVFLQLMAIILYILAEIVRSLFTGHGDPSKLCSWTSLLCRNLKPFSRVISPLES